MLAAIIAELLLVGVVQLFAVSNVAPMIGVVVLFIVSLMVEPVVVAFCLQV